MILRVQRQQFPQRFNLGIALKIPRRSAGGFSLIEVMLAVMLLAIGAAGLGLSLLSSVRGTVQAEERSQATLQASELARLIHANPAVWGHLIHGYDASQPCASEHGCEPAEWAEHQLQLWQRQLEDSMASANGIVCQDSSPLDGELSDLACDGMGEAVVKIVWREPETAHTPAGHHQIALPLPQ